MDNLTPKDFELYVKNFIESGKSEKLKNFNAIHRSLEKGQESSEFEIDIKATFEVLGGAEFILLIECKKYKRRITQDIVYNLIGKLNSSKSHKGLIFSTGGFQKGAIETATASGISLIHVIDKSFTYITKNFNSPRIETGIPDFLEVYINQDGNIGEKITSTDYLYGVFYT